jgi:hypothetical protein
MSELVRIELRQGTEMRDVHLRACLDRANDVGDLADADVLYFTRIVGVRDVAGQLVAYPGCAVCAGAADDGTLLLAVRTGPGSEQIGLVASIVHALLVRGVEVAGTDAIGAGEPSW